MQLPKQRLAIEVKYALLSTLIGRKVADIHAY